MRFFVFDPCFGPIFGSLLAAFADHIDLTMVHDILLENDLYYQNINFGNLEIRYGIKIGNFVF